MTVSATASSEHDPHDPINPDTDGDGLQDGTELGYTWVLPDPDGAGPIDGTDSRNAS